MVVVVGACCWCMLELVVIKGRVEPPDRALAASRVLILWLDMGSMNLVTGADVGLIIDACSAAHTPRLGPAELISLANTAGLVVSLATGVLGFRVVVVVVVVTRARLVLVVHCLGGALRVVITGLLVVVVVGFRCCCC